MFELAKVELSGSLEQTLQEVNVKFADKYPTCCVFLWTDDGVKAVKQQPGSGTKKCFGKKVVEIRNISDIFSDWLTLFLFSNQSRSEDTNPAYLCGSPM